MALDATVGGASADSFVSVANADTYLDTRLNVTAWTGATTPNKERALKSATREITLLLFQGSRTTTTQALAWPRAWCPNPDPSDSTDGYYADDEIPDRVTIATCELALEYLRAGTTDLAVADPNAGLIRKRVDVLEREWAPGANGRPTGWARFPMVSDTLAPLLDSAGAGQSWVRA